MQQQGRGFTFAWWNLRDFAHFDPARSGVKRWPSHQAKYEGKQQRVITAFQEMFADKFPALFGVCEITREAAQDLLFKLPQEFKVVFAPPYPRDDGFQVAVFYRPDEGLTPEPPIISTEREDVTEETRPMIPVHLTLPGHVIRFVACHWTSFKEAASRVARERLADVLRRDTHEFLEPDVPRPGVKRHVVILGDLNEEPTSPIFVDRWIGCRDRESSQRDHWRDEKVRRIRLYNASWRFMGEQVAHGSENILAAIPIAGTFFTPRLGWRTFDHLMVSGELLSPEPPYLDESQTRIVSTPVMRDAAGLPTPFVLNKPSGVSDHLPILGRLILPGF